MLDHFYIRNYSPSDFLRVEELWEQTDLGGKLRADTHEVIERTVKNGGKFLILENNSSHELIGTSWITNDSRRLYMHHFGIKPQYQGKGLSKLLLRASLNFAREQKLQIKLEVHKNNSVALEMYQKSGFQYLGDYLVFIIRDPNSIKI